MKKFQLATSLCCIILTVLLCRYIFLSEEARWLSVETPSYAVPGTDFRVNVELKKPVPGMRLGVDLHGMNHKKETLGCLSVSRPLDIIKDKTDYEFSLPVPGDIEASFIFPVITLSSDGTWSGRIKAAESDLLPVMPAHSGRIDNSIKRRGTRDTGDYMLPLNGESVIIRFITAFFLLASAVLLFAKRDNYSSVFLSLTAALSSIWEAFDSSTVIAVTLRDFTMNSGIYNLRRDPQQVLTCLIIITCAALLFYLIYSLNEPFFTISLILLTVFWCISLLKILSLHEIDRLLSLRIAGLQSGQLIRLTAAALAALIILLNIKKQDNC